MHTERQKQLEETEQKSIKTRVRYGKDVGIIRPGRAVKEKANMREQRDNVIKEVESKNKREMLEIKKKTM